MEQKRMLGALGLIFGAAVGLIIGLLAFESLVTGILCGAALGMLAGTQIGAHYL